MKFIRLNKDTVRCILSSEDMKENGLDITDFIEQNEHATNFIHSLVERAADEMGYKSGNGMVTLRVMQMPDNKLSITISETSEEELLQQNFSSKLEALFKKLSDIEDERNELFEKSTFAEDIRNNALTNKKAKEFPDLKADALAFAFKSLDSVSEFASSISYGRPINSDLYKTDGEYVLVIKRGTMSKNSYSKVCFNALDYDASLINNDNAAAVLSEHGSCLIKKKAVAVMKRI